MLDRRFAWRWLLPWEPGQRMYLSGFAEAERSFLREALGPDAQLGDPQRADGWIIDTGRAGADPFDTHECPVPETVRWVAVLGPGRSVGRWRRRLTHGFAAVREYGLLPPENPRVATPLENAGHARIALSLHRPGRRFARLAVGLAEAAARVGVLFPLRRKVLLIATRNRDVFPIGAVQAALPALLTGAGWDYALYFGTTDANRKTTVLPLGATEPNVLIKLGSSPEARRALQNEAAALAYLRESPLSGHVPELKGLVDNEYSVALYQEYRERRSVSVQKMQQAVVDFLAGLSNLERRTRPLRDVLAETDAVQTMVSDSQGSDRLALRRWLAARADDGAMILEHRSHGDFAPWNCSWTDKGLFVFDWEESRSRAPALGDAFYYAIAPALHIERPTDPKRAVGSALAFASLAADRHSSSPADVTLHFVLWTLLQRDRHPFYGTIRHHLMRELS